MTWRDAVIAGVPGRVFRISFSGELAFELNVPTPHGPAVWDAVMAAGTAAGVPVTPYGTEAMHVLRAEKGYPIIGQETDGTVTPAGPGHGGPVLDAEGVDRPALASSAGCAAPGSQAARRAAAGRPGRLAARKAPSSSRPMPTARRRPVPMLGHVTSSYRSAALGRSFALAMVKGGRDRIGERLLAPLLDGSIVEVEVTRSKLFDPENAARRRSGGDG